MGCLPIVRCVTTSWCLLRHLGSDGRKHPIHQYAHLSRCACVFLCLCVCVSVGVGVSVRVSVNVKVSVSVCACIDCFWPACSSISVTWYRKEPYDFRKKPYISDASLASDAFWCIDMLIACLSFSCHLSVANDTRVLMHWHVHCISIIWVFRMTRMTRLTRPTRRVSNDTTHWYRLRNASVIGMHHALVCSCIPLCFRLWKPIELSISSWCFDEHMSYAWIGLDSNAKPAALTRWCRWRNASNWWVCSFMSVTWHITQYDVAWKEPYIPDISEVPDVSLESHLILVTPQWKKRRIFKQEPFKKERGPLTHASDARGPLTHGQHTTRVLYSNKWMFLRTPW